jgi:hypothetical protein
VKRKETCFVCQDIRVVDLTPKWPSVEVFGARGGKLVCCDNCYPKIKSYMYNNDLSKLEYLDEMEEAVSICSYLGIIVEFMTRSYPAKYDMLQDKEKRWLIIDAIRMEADFMDIARKEVKAHIERRIKDGISVAEAKREIIASLDSAR